MIRSLVKALVWAGGMTILDYLFGHPFTPNQWGLLVGVLIFTHAVG